MTQFGRDITGFFEKERVKLLGFIRARIYDASYIDEEDIFQEVFYNLYSRADIASHVENLASYIYRSIHNKIVDLVRERKNTVSIEGAAENDDAALSVTLPDISQDPVKEAELNELRKNLKYAVSSLSRDQRNVWIATEIQGHSYKELSIIWNEPIGTLLSRKSRAVKIIREKLRNCDTDYEMEERT